MRGMALQLGVLPWALQVEFSRPAATFSFVSEYQHGAPLARTSDAKALNSRVLEKTTISIGETLLNPDFQGFCSGWNDKYVELKNTGANTKQIGQRALLKNHRRIFAWVRIR